MFTCKNKATRLSILRLWLYADSRQPHDDNSRRQRGCRRTDLSRPQRRPGMGGAERALPARSLPGVVTLSIQERRK